MKIFYSFFQKQNIEQLQFTSNDINLRASLIDWIIGVHRKLCLK